MQPRAVIVQICLAGILCWQIPVFAGETDPSPVRVARSAKPTKMADRGIQFYYEGRYQKALKLLRKALRSRKLNETRKLGALQYMAFCHVALGESAQAQDVFERLLELKPDLRLPAGTAPKIVTIFEEVRATILPPEPVDPPKLKHTAPVEPDADKAVQIVASVSHMPQGAVVLALYRHRADAQYNKLPMQAKPDGRFTANIPPAMESGATSLYYYIEVRSSLDERLLGRGRAERPIQVNFAVPPPPPEPPPEDEGMSTWWIWPVAGAVLVGAGVALGLTLAEDKKPTGSAVVNFTLTD